MSRLPWGNVPKICCYCGKPGSRSIDDRGRTCHERCLPTEVRRQRRRIEREIDEMRKLFFAIDAEENTP